MEFPSKRAPWPASLSAQPTRALASCKSGQQQAPVLVLEAQSRNPGGRWGRGLLGSFTRGCGSETAGPLRGALWPASPLGPTGVSVWWPEASPWGGCPAM